MNTAEVILVAVGLYTALGAVFGLVFVAIGVAKVDNGAARAPYSRTR